MLVLSHLSRAGDMKRKEVFCDNQFLQTCTCISSTLFQYVNAYWRGTFPCVVKFVARDTKVLLRARLLIVMQNRIVIRQQYRYVVCRKNSRWKMFRWKLHYWDSWALIRKIIAWYAGKLFCKRFVLTLQTMLSSEVFAVIFVGRYRIRYPPDLEELCTVTEFHEE